MQPSGYSPYVSNTGTKRKRSFELPDFSGRVKKIIYIILGIIVVLFFAIYISLGDLRFFVNNYLRLTWFSKNYIILLQNNYESRPGGGFITAYGNLDTVLGWPTNLSFSNSYDIDTDTYVTPPYPHEDMLKNEWYEGYTFRDANWDPDFPSNTDQITEFYLNKFPDKDVDGIIVVNFSMIEDLISRLGYIELNGNKYTKDNLFSAVTDTVNDIDRHNEQELSVRKNILSDLSAAIINKGKWHPYKLITSLNKAIKNKDIYFWFKSKGMQKKVIKKGWGNAFVLPESSDFLAVNIANLGSKKADRYIRKEVHHYVNLTKELPEVTTEIVLRYSGFKNNYADDYKGYLQLAIPGKANVNTDLLDSRVNEKGDFKIIGEKIIVPAGSKTTLTYTYTLPRSLLNNDEYRLRLIRQSGDEKYVWVTVESAPDRFMQGVDFEARENRAVFFEQLDFDRDLIVTILPDLSVPYPIEQVFSDLNTINIYWNEPIGNNGNDALNYSIKDMNITDPDVTDEVNVVYAEVVDASVSRLELEGITVQNLERYQIELKNIRDTAGNNIIPDPKFITVVQRMEEGVVIDGDAVGEQ